MNISILIVLLYLTTRRIVHWVIRKYDLQSDTFFRLGIMVLRSSHVYVGNEQILWI